MFIGGPKLDDNHQVMQKLRSISPQIEVLKLEHRTALAVLETAQGFDFCKLRLVEFLRDVYENPDLPVGFVKLLNGQLDSVSAERMIETAESSDQGCLSDMDFVQEERRKALVYKATFLFDLLLEWKEEANHYNHPADLLEIDVDLTLHPSDRSVTITSLSLIESTTFAERRVAGGMMTRVSLPPSIVLDNEGMLVDATLPWRIDLPPRIVSED